VQEETIFGFITLPITSLIELKQKPTKWQLMLKTIEGIYQDGQIHFTEPPQDIGDRS